MSAMSSILLPVLVILGVVTIHSVKGGIDLQVNPYPAPIYTQAEPGTAVLNVVGFSIEDDAALDTVSLPVGLDADYFDVRQQARLPKEWVLMVKKRIDKPVGYLFDFSVYGYYNQTVRERNVKINVTQRNIHPPSFEQQEYEFIAFRHALEHELTQLGKVTAIDRDTEQYNSVFHYHILDPVASQIFDIDLETGDIGIISDFPPDVTNMTYNVTAIDGGSPQLLNSTRVTVLVVDLAPPDIFCVAVDESLARICWKDPTNGSYVMKYELLFKLDGQNTTKIPVNVQGIQDETCSIVRGSQLHRNYTFTVKVYDGLEVSPESLQRKVVVTRKGLYGDCPQFSNCSVWEPCMNNGECLVNPDLSYTCNCTEGWGGQNCTDVDLCPTSPCNNGSCSFKGHEEVECQCPPDYYGDHCEHVLTPCSINPCGTGKCVETGASHVCLCPDGTNRSNCLQDTCESEDTYDNTGRYRWPHTLSGTEARIVCPNGPRDLIILGHYNYGKRYCGPLADGTTAWHKMDSSECKELGAEEVNSRLQSLASFTGDAAHLGADAIANVTETLEEIFAFSFNDKQVALQMTSVMGNLLEANESALIESNSRNHSSERLLWMLDQYTSEVETDNVTSVVTDNIHLMVVNLTAPDDKFTYKPEMGKDNHIGEKELSVTLPTEALADSLGDGTRLELKTFRTSSFFIPEVDVPKQEVVMKQWVLSASVHGRKLTNLTTPVELVIRNIEKGGNHTCVFWDAANKSWSSEGVVTTHQGHNYTRCYSYHLTSFAILLDPSPDYVLPPEHETILTFISYIGCGISILGLLMTIITYSLFRCLNREKSGKILMNLCTSMLLMNAIFILGSETTSTTSGDAMCKAVSVMLHYFLMTTLMWMCVEAINMYQALIKVFTRYSRYFMLKRCIAAWGIPAVIVIIILAINVDNYKTSTTLCFLSQGNPLAFYIGLLGPACLILLINTAVFIMVARVILRPKFKSQAGSSDSINPAQIRGAFTVMTLLGVTWVFGPFAIAEAKLVINYVFTILNSLQGFLIFIFRCCFNPEARMAWVMLIKTGKFKRRKGPMKNVGSENTTSSKGDSKNGSFADTTKSNVYSSFGKQRHSNTTVHNDDKCLDRQNHNNISKTKSSSKDSSMYFDDLSRFQNGDHNGITTIYTGRENGTRRISIDLKRSPDELTKL